MNSIRENIKNITNIFCALNESEVDEDFISAAANALEQIDEQLDKQLDEIRELLSLALKSSHFKRSLEEERDDYREALEQLGALLHIGTDGSYL